MFTVGPSFFSNKYLPVIIPPVVINPEFSPNGISGILDINDMTTLYNSFVNSQPASLNGKVALVLDKNYAASSTLVPEIVSIANGYVGAGIDNVLVDVAGGVNVEIHSFGNGFKTPNFNVKKNTLYEINANIRMRTGNSALTFRCDWFDDVIFKVQPYGTLQVKAFVFANKTKKNANLSIVTCVDPTIFDTGKTLYADLLQCSVIEHIGSHMYQKESHLASFKNPTSINVDNINNVIYVNDFGNMAVRKIDSNGMVTTIDNTLLDGRSVRGVSAALSLIFDSIPDDTPIDPTSSIPSVARDIVIAFNKVMTLKATPSNYIIATTTQVDSTLLAWPYSVSSAFTVIANNQPLGKGTTSTTTTVTTQVPSIWYWCRIVIKRLSESDLNKLLYYWNINKYFSGTLVTTDNIGNTYTTNSSLHTINLSNQSVTNLSIAGTTGVSGHLDGTVLLAPLLKKDANGINYLDFQDNQYMEIAASAIPIDTVIAAAQSNSKFQIISS